MPLVPLKLRKSERLRRVRRKLNESRYEAEVESSPVSKTVDDLMLDVQRSNISDPEFVQAFFELAQNLRPAIARQPSLFSALASLKQPEHLMEFTISWVNEHGDRVRKVRWACDSQLVQLVNRGWRCNYSSALGPCRGSIRLHPACNAGIIKFLALEQTIKNALLNMPMGGGMSGSDFDGNRASTYDLAAFSAAFIDELRKVLKPGEYLDIAGDLGCSERACRALHDANVALEPLVTSGRSLPVGVGKTAAAGLGAVEFGKRFFKIPSFHNYRCVISGCGNTALSVAHHLIAEGAIVLTLSDSGGYVHMSGGITFAQWQRIADLKKHNIPLRDMVKEDGWLQDLQWHRGSPWDECVPADFAWPCSCENEIDAEVAQRLAKGWRIRGLIQVSSMSCDSEALRILEKAHVKIAPAKAANVGGMAAIGLNMAEDTPVHEFEHRLRVYIGFIHDQARTVYDDFYPDLKFKAAVDICGFLRVARALYEKGQW